MTATGNSVLAALGVISATTARGKARRDAARNTWLRIRSDAFAVRFVLRCGKLSHAARYRLVDDHRDVLCSDIPASEGRLRGPILALAWWLKFALQAFPTAAFVCKSDSDVFLHLPDLILHMRAMLATDATRAGSAYFGNFGWFSLVHRVTSAEKPGVRRHAASTAFRTTHGATCAVPYVYVCSLRLQKFAFRGFAPDFLMAIRS